MKIALPLLFSLALAAPAVADDCRHTAPRQLSAPSEGVKIVEVHAGAGALVVRGGAAAGIRASGTACSSSADALEKIRLESKRTGDRLVIEAVFPEMASWGFGWNLQRRLDFTVELPQALPVRIDDGSGSIEVRNVAAADIDDGSGEIEVRGVAGTVTVDDGSGDISIVDAGGVAVEDGSGSIDIRSIRGAVVIEEDGSGAIEIADVTGNVTIEDDGSGSIAVRNVSGDFTLRDDGSGGVTVDGVRGKVSIPRDK
ncbi:MAG TPA: hypothetical protein VGF40_18110 [Thermoanaerobaculia bacterium]